jgi:hypothetical protein
VSTAAPLVSVVVPTRDRPRFLRWGLAAAAAQTMDDYEVIVCDNATTESAEHVVADIADPRVRYLAPERPLSMCDNWERALASARGRYIAMMTDKMALFPNALAALADVAETSAPDVVTWWNSGYRPIDEGHDLGAGYFVAAANAPTDPSEYSLREALERRLSFSVRRERSGTDYFRAKILFGAFSADLVARIRARTGRVFFPITPDYTSTAAASVVGDRGVDLGRAHVVSFESAVSNGKRYADDLVHARSFLEQSDPSNRIIDELPIPGVYASVHNLVAYDLVSSATRNGGAEIVGASLDLEQLAVRAAEDLALVRCRDKAQRQVRDAQRDLLGAWTSRHGIHADARAGSGRARARARARRALASSQSIERLALRATGRSPARFDNIVQAAAAATS